MPSEIGAALPVSGIPSKMIFAFIALLIVAAAALMGSTGGKNFLGDLFPTPPESVTELQFTPILASSSGTDTVVPAFETNVSALEVGPFITGTSTPVLIAADTSTPRPAETVTPLPHLHGFEVTKMPPGGDQGYLVHIVAVGETLDMIADHYDTTIQAILAVNYKLKPPVWVQYPIVIPVGADDVAGYTAFEVYVVVEAYEVITAESLASILGVEASVLEFYNMCTGNCQFHKGDVLLIPRTQ